MNYPDFFDSIPKIKLQDSLSKFLGTFDNGIMEFSYLDVVKSAGHSCPTVAGAYISTLVGLKELYRDEMPQRGLIKVEFAGDQTEGVVGVIGAVISNITGATTNYGFQGIGNNFNRRNLMFFNQRLDSQGTKFTRVDTGKSVSIVYHPNSISPKPEMQPLMQKIMQGLATDEEKKRFGELWQERVKTIFENIDKVVKVV